MFFTTLVCASDHIYNDIPVLREPLLSQPSLRDLTGASCATDALKMNIYIYICGLSIHSNTNNIYTLHTKINTSAYMHNLWLVTFDGEVAPRSRVRIKRVRLREESNSSH